uniref:Mitochondrial glycoprotein n=1 Tax=Leersia perrieri TaxID=77586 RepID=A0A0D9UWM7_9ORYZ
MPFSSAPSTKPSSDGDLLRIIESEIKYAEETDDHDRVEEIPDNFPFEISDEKGSNAITLTRTYQGQKIEVLVSMPSLVTGDEPDHENEADKDTHEISDHDEEEETQKPPKSSIPLTVTISKEEGQTLEFTCTAYPDEIVIDTLSVVQPSKDEEDIPYEGPDFNDLDENLQRAFHKYLELRGITPMATNFLHEYMINKDSREYLLWLRKLKDFVRH